MFKSDTHTLPPPLPPSPLPHRKQDFRDLKQLQREEMKEATEFYDRIKVDKDAQEKKFESENAELGKRYGVEVEIMLKKQKKEVERLENHHIQQFRSRSKLLRSSQVRCCVM